MPSRPAVVGVRVPLERHVPRQHPELDALLEAFRQMGVDDVTHRLDRRAAVTGDAVEVSSDRIGVSLAHERLLAVG